MAIETSLPGLDRLIAVCQRHKLPLRLLPALSSAPRQGDLLFGEPLDPQLAAVYQRLGAAELGPFSLYRPGPERLDLIAWNTEMKKDGTEPFRSTLIFGRETGFALYYGTIPALADRQGLQPVTYMEAMDVQFGVPLASSVNRFFELYSQYLERMVVDSEYIHTGLPALSFPWGVPELVAQDEPLIAQVRAGCFDFLINGYEGARQWLRELQAPHP